MEQSTKYVVEQDRHTWHVGLRVSRKTTDEIGSVVEVNGRIKVKWDGGRTSYFQHGDQANVHLAVLTQQCRQG